MLRVISIKLVTLPVLLYIVRFTNSISRFELFALMFIRKLPEMFVFVVGWLMVAFGMLSISIVVMLMMFWFPAKSVALIVML